MLALLYLERDAKFYEEELKELNKMLHSMQIITNQNADSNKHKKENFGSHHQFRESRNLARWTFLLFF